MVAPLLSPLARLFILIFGLKILGLSILFHWLRMKEQERGEKEKEVTDGKS